MKAKKIFSMIMVYLYAITMFIGLTPVKTLADANYVVKNIDTTVANELQIDPAEKIEYAVQYNDSRLIATDKGIYYIEPGHIKKISINFTGWLRSSEYVDRVGNEVFIIGSDQNILYSINLVTGAISEKDMNTYINDGIDRYYDGAGAIDPSGNKWFAVSEYNGGQIYNLLKVDTAGKAVEYQIKQPTNIASMGFDNNNNLRFITNSDALGTFNTATKSASTVDYDGYIIAADMAKNGDLWIVDDVTKKIKHLNSSNTVVESFTGTNPVGIDVDESGNVWLLDNGAVKKLQSNSFVTMFNVPTDRTTISEANGSLLLTGAKGVTTIDAVPASGSTPIYTPTPASASASAPSYPNQLVQINSYGQSVTTIQDKLKSLGFDSGQIDGKFGPITRNAVISFQKAKGLVPDGIVGPLTWGKLFGFNVGAYSGYVSEGDGTISIVGGIQDKLISLGFNPGIIDGIFGSKTLTAIKIFQRVKNLTVDGIVGPLTWKSLFG